MSSQVEFAAVMVPANGQAWWWYDGVTSKQVGEFLTQNKAMLTDIDAYIDNDNTLKFVVAMEPVTEGWWWWWGQTGAQVGQLLTQNKAGLTDISAYVDPSDNTLKFAVIMAEGQDAWWYWGKNGPQLGQLLAQNKARLAAVSAYLASSENSITLSGSPNVSGLNGHTTLTVLESGAYSFSGSWRPSNWEVTGLISQDVNFASTLLDARGTAWIFSTSGTVPIEGTYSFNVHGTNPSLAANWQFLQLACTPHDKVNAGLDLGVTWSSIVSWYKQNEQTIDEVVQVVGEIATAVAS